MTLPLIFFPPFAAAADEAEAELFDFELEVEDEDDEVEEEFVGASESDVFLKDDDEEDKSDENMRLVDGDELVDEDAVEAAG